MKETLIVAVLLVLWFSLLVADVRAYPHPKDGNVYSASANIPSQITAPDSVEPPKD